MVRHIRKNTKGTRRTKAIRHTSKVKVTRKTKITGRAIVRCPKCKEGRVVKARGLIFCGYCGHEF